MELQKKPNEEIIALEKLPKQLIEPIRSVINNIGYTTYAMRCKNLSTDGGSFIGVLYEIDLNGSTPDGTKEINIFVKSKVENAQLKIYSIPECFVRESLIYKELSDIFVELQNEANIPDCDRFKMAKHFDECNASSIILENLTKRGFKTYYRMDIISLEYAEMSIKHLAKFHGLSFVIQQKRLDYFKDKVVPMKQPFVFGDEWDGLVKNMSNFSINCLEPKVKANVGESILKKVDQYGNYMKDISGVLTLCHGDYKHNNIMAKENNGKLTEVLAIDYQLLHHGKPILDLLYFIFNGTDQEFRRNHLTHLRNLYYDSMKYFLDYFRIDIESVFSRDEFEREFKEKLDFGLMINAFYVPFLFATEEDAPVVNQSLDTMAFNVDKRFTERFRGVVDDFINWGYLTFYP